MKPIPENVPQKSIENFHIEHEIMDYSNKDVARLTTEVGKIMDKCMDFYKSMLTTHN